MPGNTARLIIEADSRGIRKGTDDLRKLDKQAARTEKGTKRLGKALLTMGKVAGVAATALGAVFVRGVIKNTIEQEQAVAQLNASLESTGRFTKEASQALQDHAAALQQNSTFGDEAIISMQSQLLTFKQLGGEVLPRTTQAVLDLSTKMDQGLKESAVQLGKALNDPIANLGALGRVGIQFSKDQKELIKTLAETGKLAEAQAIILDELESEFGGAAKAARVTFGGALSTLKHNFGDLLEVSGDGTSGVTDSLNELADILGDPAIKQGFQDLATGALNFLGVLAKIPATVGFLGDELRQLFGIVDNDDFVRRDEEIADLEEQLVSSRDSANAWYRTENNIFHARAASLEKEIALKKELLQADRDAAGLAPAPVQATADVAANIPAVLGGPAVPDALSPTVEFDMQGMDEAIRIATRLEREAEIASDALRESLRELAEETGGPVVVANHRLEDALRAVQEQEDALRAAGKLTTEAQHDLTEAREGAIIVHEREIELLKIEAEERANVLTPAEQMIQSLELEIELQGLSNVERAKKIALLRAETDATTENGQAIIANIETIAANDELIRSMDTLRAAGTDALVSIADGSKSAKEAFSDFMETMRNRILQMLAEKLIEQLFGGFGSTGGGAFGGIFGSLFGGARAAGGPVSPGAAYLVGEQGPELIVPTSPGTVIPNNQLNNNVVPITQAKNTTTNITVNLPPSIRRITAQQTASEVARIQKRASTRNR